MKRPQITESSLEQFLYGHNPLKGIRNVELIPNTNKVHLFQKTENEGVRVLTDSFTPFAWVKSVQRDNFFTYDTAKINKDAIHDRGEKCFFVIDGCSYCIDGKEAKIVAEKDDVLHIRYKVKVDGYKKLLVRKAQEYGIKAKKLTTFYEGMVETKRMAEGFKFLYEISEPNAKQSSNPFFDGKRNELVGSFNNLRSFFEEGGISMSGVYHLDLDAFLEKFDKLSFNTRLKIFLAFVPYLRDFDIFDVEGFALEKVVELLRSEQDFNKMTIGNYQETFKDVKKLELIYRVVSKAKMIKSIKAHEKKATTFVIRSRVFDGFNNSNFKDWVEYLKGNDFDFFEVKDKMVFSVAPVEQYMIQKGVRLLKGVEEYSDLNSLVMDIETHKSEEFEEEEDSALNPEKSSIMMIGMYMPKINYSKIIYINSPKEELDAICSFYELIAEKFPDLILTYNGEDFDYPYMQRRMEIILKSLNAEESAEDIIRKILGKAYERLGIENLSSNSIYQRTPSVCKVGGSTENYIQTKAYGLTFFDVLYAVKRARAQDKSIPSNKLKENIMFSNLAKKNRVYVEGSQIGQIYNDQNTYLFDDSNGSYLLSRKEVLLIEQFDDSKIKQMPNGGYYYDDNRYLFLYAKQGTTSDNKYSLCQNVNFYPDLTNQGQLGNEQMLQAWKNELVALVAKKYVGIKIPKLDYGLRFKEKYPSSYTLYKHNLRQLKNELEDISTFFENTHVKTTGKYIVERYLIDDLYETAALDELRSQATFEVCKWMPTNYLRVATMGGATVWKLLLAAWSYEYGIAVPNYDEAVDYGGGLLGMVDSGFLARGVKADFASLYPSIFYEEVAEPDIDISGFFKYIVKYGLDKRLLYKGYKKEAEARGDKKMTDKWDAKQLPLKILINSFYGMLGAASVSPWSHITSAHAVTAFGRQHIRHLIMWFEERNFKIVYFHTDGANFIIPKGAEEYTYIGQGLNRLSVKDKEYKGVPAYVAQYNDTYLRGMMGVDIDEYFDACINFAKGNVIYFKYSDKTHRYKFSAVGGNLIRSNQNKFIKDFIEKYTPLLAQDGHGRRFVEAYQDQIEKIYNFNLSKGEICNVGKINQSLEEYAKTKKRISVHKELALENYKKGKSYSLGDLVYYINVGKAGIQTESDYGAREEFGVFLKDVDLPSQGKLADFLPILIQNLNNGNLKTSVIDVKNGGGSNLFGNTPEQALKDYIQSEGWTDFECKIKSNGKQSITFTKIDLYVEEVHPSDFDSKGRYNAYKYIQQFNSSVEQLLIVFKPSVRNKILYNPFTLKGKAAKTVTKTRTVFEDSDLELVNGYPLEGKEDKQDTLEELMYPDEVEVQLWKRLGYHPHFVFNNVVLDKAAKYHYYGNGQYQLANENETNVLDCEALIDELCKIKVYEKKQI